MDLTYTNAQRDDLGVLKAYALDMSFGTSENDFELVCGPSEPVLEDDAIIYCDGTEYGGIIDGKKSVSNSETITYCGRTWHGLLNSKVIEPDNGDDYFIVSGEANAILSTLVVRLGLTDLFSAASEQSGINISRYQFNRYCKGYDGICAMLASVNAKLKISWDEDCSVKLCAVPIVDYTEDPADGDTAVLSVEQYANRVNHLICLGRGNLSAREVIHLYVDQFGKIGTTQYYTGIKEYSEIYDNANAESSEVLKADGIKKLTELCDINKSDISVKETDTSYDIGDIVGATDYVSGLSVATAVTQKIIRINNGIVDVEHKTGS